MTRCCGHRVGLLLGEHALAAVVGAVLLRGGRHNRTVERAWAQFAAVPAVTAGSTTENRERSIR
jgi:hypothetical protein